MAYRIAAVALLSFALLSCTARRETQYWGNVSVIYGEIDKSAPAR